jgi:hypothetical protein
MPASSRGRAGRDRPFLVEPLGEKGYAAIAYQVHFPAESWHTGDIDFAVALDLFALCSPSISGCATLSIFRLYSVFGLAGLQRMRLSSLALVLEWSRVPSRKFVQPGCTVTANRIPIGPGHTPFRLLLALIPRLAEPCATMILILCYR